MAPNASATGRSVYCGLGFPFGRPRWLASTTVAPASSAYRTVGSDARSRVSSPIFPSFTGTLKSTRMKTRLPLRSTSLIESFGMGSAGSKGPGLQALFHQHAQQIDAATRIAPLVVVPGENLDEIAVHHLRVGRVDDRRVRIALEI